MTSITEPALLRASHIKPWKHCQTSSERLDPFNGLLRSALWDAAFDKGLVTFDDQGAPIFAGILSPSARTVFQWNAPIPLHAAHLNQLA